MNRVVLVHVAGLDALIRLGRCVDTTGALFLVHLADLRVLEAAWLFEISEEKSSHAEETHVAESVSAIGAGSPVRRACNATAMAEEAIALLWPTEQRLPMEGL